MEFIQAGGKLLVSAFLRSPREHRFRHTTIPLSQSARQNNGLAAPLGPTPNTLTKPDETSGLWMTFEGKSSDGSWALRVPTIDSLLSCGSLGPRGHRATRASPDLEVIAPGRVSERSPRYAFRLLL